MEEGLLLFDDRASQSFHVDLGLFERLPSQSRKAQDDINEVAHLACTGGDDIEVPLSEVYAPFSSG